MTISENTLVEGSLRSAPGGFEIELLLNWYRALPLSCVNTVDLAVDGRPVARTAMTFVINGRARALDELVDLYDESWFVQDHAVLRVHWQPHVRRGQTLQVDLRLGCLIPYILTAPAQAFESLTAMSRTMIVQ